MIVIAGPWAQEVFPDEVFPEEVFPKIREYEELGDPVKEFDHGGMQMCFAKEDPGNDFERKEPPTDFDVLEHAIDFDEVII